MITRPVLLRVLMLCWSVLPLSASAQVAPLQPGQFASLLTPLSLKPRAASPVANMGPHADTRCELCHTTASWSDATFSHDKTGFALEGAHAQTPCKGCHTVDFKAPIARLCSGCHTDVHRSDFGQRCEGCHTADTWRTTFTADAHRKTNFPLIGRHAFLPCTECHTEQVNRRFTRTTVDCISCHQADYARTAGLAVNHAALGFGVQCRQCHVPFSFKGAHFADHDACFQLTAGPHARLGCLNCHTSLAGAKVTGTCATNTAACTACHVHQCAKVDTLHTRVAGYQCKDRKCYECHRFAKGP